MLDKVRSLIEQVEEEDRDTFLKRFTNFLSPMDPRFMLIEKVYDDVEDALGNLERRSGGKYMRHIRAVTAIVVDYLRVQNHVVIVGSIGHDLVEDSNSWTVQRIQAIYGDDVARVISYSSKPPLEEYPSRKERDKVFLKCLDNAPREVKLIKLPDRLHNLMTMWDFAPEEIRRKVEETERYFMPFAEKEIILIHEFEEILGQLKEQLVSMEKPKNSERKKTKK